MREGFFGLVGFGYEQGAQTFQTPVSVGCLMLVKRSSVSLYSFATVK